MRRPPDRNNHTTRHQSQVAGDLFGFTADFDFTADVSASQQTAVTFWLHRG